LLPLARASVVGLLVLAIANGGFLYLAPSRAETDYAWSISPPINAAFLGAGYLAGTVATALVVFVARWWRSLRVLPLPLAALSLSLLAATAIHADRFRWDFAPTWLWTAVYVTVPVLVVLVWRLQEQAAPSGAPADPRLRLLRGWSGALGLVMLVGALALFAAPDAGADVWPWPLTPLLGRAVASWYLLIGTSLVTAAVSLRRGHEVVIPYATLLAWTVLLLLLPALHADDLAGRSVALTIWLAGHAVLLGLALYAVWLGVALMRGTRQRL